MFNRFFALNCILNHTLRLMKQIINHEPLSYLILNLLEKGHNRIEIENNLIADGHDAQLVKRLIFELRQILSDKRKIQGVTLMLLGSVICLVCMILTVLPYFPQHQIFHKLLFAISSMAAVLVTAGVALMFI